MTRYHLIGRPVGENPRGYGHDKQEQSDAIWWLIGLVVVSVVGGPVLVWLIANDVFAIF